jgi:hypothetical protein
MRIINLSVALIVAMTPRLAPAQAVRRANLTVEQFAANAYQLLFRGITMSADREATARAIVLAEMEAQHRIDGRTPEGWNQRIVLNKSRDSTLRALLTTDVERRQFDENAGPLRPHGQVPPRPIP